MHGNCHESNSQAAAVGGIFGHSHTAGVTMADRLNMSELPYANVEPTFIASGMDPDDAVLLTEVATSARH
jgi:hypothetical protein